MPKDAALLSVHQTGEAGEEILAEKGASAVDTFGGKVFVRWDPDANVTAFGPAAYFIEFLKTNGLWESWVRDCPLQYKSANAPPKQDILGTAMLFGVGGSQALCAHHHGTQRQRAASVCWACSGCVAKMQCGEPFKTERRNRTQFGRASTWRRPTSRY